MVAEYDPLDAGVKDIPFKFGMEMRMVGADGTRWFDLQQQDQDKLVQRKHELNSQLSDRLIAWSNEASPLLQSALQLYGVPDLPPTKEGMTQLAVNVGHDFAFMAHVSGNEPVMVGGAVLFPTGWDPVDKLGKGISEIHSRVPAEPNLVRSMTQFLNHLKPDGKVYERSRWSLYGSNELNAHPSKSNIRIYPDMSLSEMSLRIEHQGFTGLTGGSLFMIDVHLFPLNDALPVPGVKDRLVKQLKTMSDRDREYMNVDLQLVRRIEEF